MRNGSSHYFMGIDEEALHQQHSLMLVLIVTTILTVLASPSIALGNVETFKATHTYVLGDDDSKDDARQRCLLEAKRKILEQAGVYIESISQVKNLALTKDTITSYAAAVM